MASITMSRHRDLNLESIRWRKRTQAGTSRWNLLPLRHRRGQNRAHVKVHDVRHAVGTNWDKLPVPPHAFGLYVPVFVQGRRVAFGQPHSQSKPWGGRHGEWVSAPKKPQTKPIPARLKAEEQKKMGASFQLGAGLLPQDNFLQDFLFTRHADVSKWSNCSEVQKSEVEGFSSRRAFSFASRAASFCTNTALALGTRQSLSSQIFLAVILHFLKTAVLTSQSSSNPKGRVSTSLSLTVCVFCIDGWATGTSGTTYVKKTCNGISSINMTIFEEDER